MAGSNSQRGLVEMALVLVGFLVLVGIGMLWFLTQTQTNKKLSTPNFSESGQDAQNSSPAPEAGTNASLDAELEAIEVEDPAGDLKEIDSDLNSL